MTDVEPLLRVRGLSKRFGAIEVTRAVDLDLPAGARTALIGPNGAGKTTFVNLLTGVLTTQEGEVRLEGRSILRDAPARRVKAGLVRTHQINTLLTECSVLDNVALTVAERDGLAWRMLRYSRAWRACRDEAASRLQEIGLGHVLQQRVSALPYGQQRLLEIAIALALKPKVLLLDEPAAGVPSSETHVIKAALDALPEEMAILIIEHDMDLVFRYAREIVVLVQGAVLRQGPPDRIANDPEVRAVYLGKEAA